ncbi:hypothetical protein [Streptomyces sp. N35]|uniref:hypothetical protein n=1 Tax=Streptomyces sp. N35 TaxID=2795730 RepID=UPI0018F5317A|nr:hypothetical protein [Streptomyces sp. N35]
MDIVHVLARAFAAVSVSIDLSDDDDIDPHVANNILEPATAMFRDLSLADRAELAEMFVEISELEGDPVRREAILSLPEVMGLLDED